MKKKKNVRRMKLWAGDYYRDGRLPDFYKSVLTACATHGVDNVSPVVIEFGPHHRKTVQRALQAAVAEFNGPLPKAQRK